MGRGDRPQLQPPAAKDTSHPEASQTPKLREREEMSPSGLKHFSALLCLRQSPPSSRGGPAHSGVLALAAPTLGEGDSCEQRWRQKVGMSGLWAHAWPRGLLHPVSCSHPSPRGCLGACLHPSSVHVIPLRTLSATSLPGAYRPAPPVSCSAWHPIGLGPLPSGPTASVLPPMELAIPPQVVFTQHLLFEASGPFSPLSHKSRFAWTSE